jgi:glucose/arabinose dehydrogenase
VRTLKKLLITLAIVVAVVVVTMLVLVRLNPGLPLANLGQGMRPETIKLPVGFRLDLFASDVDGARSLAVSDRGTVFVGTREKGVVYALPDANGDGKADRVAVVARGLDSPNGVAFRDGSLYVAEISRVIRFDEIDDHLDVAPSPVVVSDTFPKEATHGWKYIAFGPDGKLYVPVGAAGNVGEWPDERFATIMRMNADGSGLEIFARGVRNTVGFDWDPATGDLWFTDNGRDWLGDDLPPDELNHAAAAGLHFGFPYRFGQNQSDPDFGPRLPAGLQTVPAALDLPAHVAALGMRFYDGSMFPEEYRAQVFIAEHGSWNRSTPDGYRVIVVHMKDGRAVSSEVFAEGWLQARSAWGRPVDVMVMLDGALLVSDDRAGAVYRISYAR